MENLLNNIENSENNNPLLTAALQEIVSLKSKLDQCKMVVFGDMAHYNENDDILEEVKPEDQNNSKIGALTAIFLNN